MTQFRLKEKSLEIIFVAAFSALAFSLFFTLLSANGLVLGNDPAIHLGRTEMFLTTGRIPLDAIGWYPPLYNILLASIIAFTGATSIQQALFLMKILTALIDSLLLLAIYLVGAKFFGKKYGAIASALALLSFPLYEINFWGGYTGILSLVFMCLLILYIASVKKGIVSILITFMFAFSLVLSHQLATFLVALILPPFFIIMLVKSKGRLPKAWIAAILGGVVAFFLYYFQAIISNIDVLISHIFFDLKTMLYQVPAVTIQSFIVNFGFIFVFAFLGVIFAFFKLKEKKKLAYFSLLSLSLFVPLFLSQSYFIGLYLPYQWFIYFLLPTIAIFAALPFSFIIDWFFICCSKIRKGSKIFPKIAIISIVIIMSVVLLFRFQTVGDRINKSGYFYSFFDSRGYEAALWFKDNFPETATTVVTQKPGSWFGLFSDKYVIAATNPFIDRNVIAESVLDLSCEIEHPLTLIRAYEAKGDVSEEYYVSVNDVWRRVSYLAKEGVFLSFNANDNVHYLDLSDLKRELVSDAQTGSGKFVVKYSNDDVLLTETLLVHSDSYPITVVWALSSLRSDITNATLYISNFFDLSFSFEKAFVSGSLDWENPWNRPSYIHGDNEWAVVNFTRETMADDYIGFYDEKSEIAFSLKFMDLPDWGNVGVLTSGQIDAVRFQYEFDEIKTNKTVASTYQVVAFSRSSFSEMPQLDELRNMFNLKPDFAFDLKTRNFAEYIQSLNIEFIVYDRNRFDSKLLFSRILQLVYSNDGYVICRIKTIN